MHLDSQNFDNPSVAVIGAGQMGTGIAEIFLLASFRVFLFDVHEAARDKALENLTLKLDKAVLKNRITLENKEQFLHNLNMCSDMTQLHLCHFVIEAIAENYDSKTVLLKKLSDIVADGTIVATNTSSLSVTKLALSYKKPENFIGIHFFNPPQVLPLVEIVPHMSTQTTVVEGVKTLIGALGKLSVICKDSPGFIVNRILIPMINQAGHMLDSQIASAKDIDKAMCLGANFPMGLLALADFIGLDTVVSILQAFYHHDQNPQLKPAQCFIDAIMAGNLGHKTGQGIFDYKSS